MQFYLKLTLGIVGGTCILALLYSMTPNQGGIHGCERSTRVKNLERYGFVISNENFQLSCVKRYLLDVSHVDVKLFEMNLIELGYPAFKPDFSVDIKCRFPPNFFSMTGEGSVKGDIFWIYSKSKNLVEVVISN